MNKKNMWVHLGIALFVVGIAAIAGQIRSWQVEFSETKEAPIERIEKTIRNAPKRAKADSEPEVLVRFRPEISFSQIKKIISRNNDRVRRRDRKC